MYTACLDSERLCILLTECTRVLRDLRINQQLFPYEDLTDIRKGRFSFL